MTASYTWQPIQDLPDDFSSLTDGELEPLHRVWLVQKEELSQAGLLDEFSKRLRREWAIETGIIERVYELDRGVTRTLIEQGIDAALIPHGKSRPEGAIVAQTVQDHYDALDGIFDVVAGQRPLTTGYIKELHAALLRNQTTYHPVDPSGRTLDIPLEKGVYKRLPNSPTRNGSVHEYCPPEHVASEMDCLIQMYEAHQSKNVPPEVEAAWLHHRFTQIHPFADGNGRVARAIASLVFIKADWFPLVVKRDDWERYIDALEKSDRGDLKTLVHFFVEAQRNALILTTDLAHEVRPISSVEDAIAAVRERLLQKGRMPAPDWISARDVATTLIQQTESRLSEVSRELNSALSHAAPRRFAVGNGVVEVGLDFRVSLLKQADFAAFNRFVRLALDLGRPDALELFFCSIPPKSLGLIMVVTYLMVPGEQTSVLPGGTFQINGREDPKNLQERFAKWLDAMIVAGLTEWRKRL